ncbi:MAG: hypothetical protein N3A66_08350, partial [Planctomycetota bacterium]|nr:hypothetical protein [Planctomycetota bacterium]
TWEYRIFGVWGHPLRRPLDDWENLLTYRPPLPPPLAGDALAAARRRAAEHKKRYYLTGWGGELFERLRALRRYEDVLVDLALAAPEINRLADIVVAHMQACVANCLATGVDAVCFGDDFGT